MQIRLLGPVDAIDRGVAVDVGGPRPTRVLLALAMAERHRLSLDELTDRCFDDGDRPADPIPSLRTAIRRLRRALGDDTIVTQVGAYELVPGDWAIDLDEFDDLVAAGRRASDPIDAASAFRRALDLWRGEPFGHFADLAWLDGERTRLEEQRLVAVEGWHDAHIRNGTSTEIVPSLESAVAQHPLRERLQRQLMHGLFQVGRQADALRAFQTHREQLAEAGLEPGPETVALEQRIAIADPTLLIESAGQPLRGYRILERLGEGAFATVFRGTQPSVDRDVAIKQIRAEFANQPDFIRRFEAEAHLVARLEHPFIVPLYDFWREPDSAYLVMRYLSGGSLESALFNGAWDLERTGRMVEQVGQALVAAHRSGIVHRDVKPANVLLDDVGNTYLADFGIALGDAADPARALSAGSPAYASPEQLRREPVGPAADVHGFAITVYEALTGRLPFPNEPSQAALLRRQLEDPIPPIAATRDDIPQRIDDVLQRATTKDPASRIASIEQFVAEFEAAVLPSAVASTFNARETMRPSAERNPYKGLRAFDEADDDDFAGRDRLVDQLLEVLTSERILTVVGPSGSGKSSAVRAGLLPALRSGAIDGSNDWYVTTMIPGRRPFEELEAALVSVAAEHPSDLLSLLRDGERGIARAIRRVIPPTTCLVLVIDQFEELFTLCDDEAERRQFLDALASAMADERSKLRVVITLRADFYDRPLRYESFGRLLRDATVPVLPLAADELEQAIVQPATAVGCDFEGGLVAEIVADVADQPGALPMLQYALTQLYERRSGTVFTRDAYRRLGGLTGALASRAEEIFDDLPADAQTGARRLFARLVTLGEGTDDTRRRVLRSELAASSSTELILSEFGGARLLTFDRDPITREPTVEVAHEALIREWPRLRGWLDDDRDGLRIHRHLTETTQAWTSANRDPGELYRGGRLETAAAWAETHHGELNPAEREFIDASTAAQLAEVAAAKASFDQQVRSNRRLRVLLTVAAVVAIIAAAAGIVAVQQRSQARESAAEAERQSEIAAANAERAETEASNAEANAAEALLAQEQAEDAAFTADIRRMIADSGDLRDDDPALSMLVALAAHQIDPSPATLGAVQQSLVRTDGLLGHVAAEKAWGFEQSRDTYNKVVLMDDTTLVAQSNNTMDVWNLERGELVGSLNSLLTSSTEAGGGEARLIEVLDGSHLVGLTQPTLDISRLRVVDVHTDTVVFERDLDTDVLYLASDSRTGTIATTSGQGEVRLLNRELDVVQSWGLTLSTGTTPRITDVALAGDAPILSLGTWVAEPNALIDVDAALVALSPDGGIAWTRRWDDLLDEVGVTEASGRLIFDHIEADPTGSIIYAYTSDEARFSRVGWHDGIGVWAIDAATGSVLEHWPRRGSGTGLHVSDRTVIAGVEVIDRSTGEPTRMLPRLDNRPPVVAIAPSGRFAAVDGPDEIQLWSLDGSQVLAPAVPVEVALNASVDQPGSRIAYNNGADGDHGLGSLEDGQLPLPAADGGVSSAWWASSGDLVTWRLTTGFSIWSGSNLELIGTTDGRPMRWSAFDVSPMRSFGVGAGNSLAGRAGMIEIWDLERGEIIGEIDTLLSGGTSSLHEIRNFQFSSDGRRMAAVDGRGRAIVVTFGSSVDDWEATEIDVDAGEAIRAVAFDRAGDRLAVHDDSGQVSIVNLASGLVESTLVVGAPAFADQMGALAFGADATMVVGLDVGVRVWDIATGLPIGRTLPNESLAHGTPSADGRWATTGRDGTLLVWDLDPESWLDTACLAAGRDITIEEWERYAPTGTEYRELCAK